MENLRRIEDNDLIALIIGLSLGEGRDVALTYRHETLELFNFRVEKINFHESDVLLIGGYGLYTVALSINTSYDNDHIEDLLKQFISNQIGQMEYTLYTRKED